MPDFVTFNSGPHPLLSSDTSAEVIDGTGDGLSDGVRVAFTGEDGRRYLVSAEADPVHHQWGEGATLRFVDNTYGQAALLASYRLDAQSVPQPQDIGTHVCQQSPAAAGLALGAASATPMPVSIHAGTDAPYRNRMLPWLQFGVASSHGETRIEFTSEGALAGVYYDMAMLSELGANGARTELGFMPPGQTPR